MFSGDDSKEFSSKEWDERKKVNFKGDWMWRCWNCGLRGRQRKISNVEATQQSQAKRKCNLIAKIEQIQHHELVSKLQKVSSFAWCIFVCCDSSSLACYRVPKGVKRWTRNIIEVLLVRNFLILEKNFMSQNVFVANLLVCGCILEISRVDTFGKNLSLFVVLGETQILCGFCTKYCFKAWLSLMVFNGILLLVNKLGI